MRRFAVVALTTTMLVAALPSEGSAHASEIETATGALRFSPDALKVYGFESAADVVASGVSLTRWDTSGFPPKLVPSEVKEAATIEPFLVKGADALEGKGVIRLGSLPGSPTAGIALLDTKFFDTLQKRRISITVWGRAEGSAPSLQVFYGRADWVLDAGFNSFAKVVTTRSGRETTDGWVEYTTGEIDGSVWGIPIKAITITPSSRIPKGYTFVVDAIEVRPAPGSIMEPLSCTMRDVETTCGAMGDCMYGHCVPSVYTWGVLPPPAHRQELAERWIHIAANLTGDRNSSTVGATTFTTGARNLAKYAYSSRQFYGGLNRLVSSLRDQHTSFGGPPGDFTMLGPKIEFGWTGALDACFGVVDVDVGPHSPDPDTGLSLGYAVWYGGAKPTTGVKLERGDVLVSVDGEAPKAWVDHVWPEVAGSMPNDPASDWGWSAESISAMITARARSIQVARCTSKSACTGADRKLVTIEVGEKVYQQILKTGGREEGIEFYGCYPRFHGAVDAISEGASGEDTVTAQLKGDVVHVQFDGFSGQSYWPGAMGDIFNAKPAKVLMDARQGNGGDGNNTQALLDLLRGTDEPIGVFTVIRGQYDVADPPSLLEDYRACIEGEFALPCFVGAGFGFFTSVEVAPSGKTKIAWLNTADVSANDFMPRLLQGRSNFRIFGPTATSGAFGAITNLPALAPGWSGGTLQIHDSRFAATFDDFAAARWESSHGVPPDEYVAQKLSDIFDDRDTMLEAARAWLAK
ncbi:MAG: hypothetical protein ABI175_19890 [Polyangiales bacterium]